MNQNKLRKREAVAGSTYWMVTKGNPKWVSVNFISLGTGYIVMFTLWKFFKLYTYEVYTSLYVHYVCIMFQNNKKFS